MAAALVVWLFLSSAREAASANLSDRGPCIFSTNPSALNLVSSGGGGTISTQPPSAPFSCFATPRHFPLRTLTLKSSSICLFKSAIRTPSSCVPGSGIGGGARVCETRLPPVKPKARASELHSIGDRKRFRKLDWGGGADEVVVCPAAVDSHRRRYW